MTNNYREDKIYSKDDSYNNNLYTRESHNCYTYFLNLKSSRAFNTCKHDFKTAHICRRPQPGYAAQLPRLNRRDYTCNTMMKRTLKDNKNLFKTTKKSCPKSHYKGALVVAPYRDFHYYRLNDDGVWTHKPGYKPSTNVDSDKMPITNPEKANRNYGALNYSDFCGYLCVPRSRTKKTMKMLKHTKH